MSPPIWISKLDTAKYTALTYGFKCAKPRPSRGHPCLTISLFLNRHHHISTNYSILPLNNSACKYLSLPLSLFPWTNRYSASALPPNPSSRIIVLRGDMLNFLHLSSRSFPLKKMRQRAQYLAAIRVAQMVKMCRTYWAQWISLYSYPVHQENALKPPKSKWLIPAKIKSRYGCFQ